MKYTGKAYDLCADQVTEYSVQAALTQHHIAIDWVEDGEPGHLDAEVADHVYFRGYYGYPAADPNRSFELRRYSSDGGVILFGTWRTRQEGWSGNWLFVLWPADKGE